VGLQDEVTSVYATFEEKLHPDDRAAAFAAMQALLERGDPYFVEYRLRARDGGWRWFESRAMAVRDAEGRPERVIGSVTDIDARKRAEEAARVRTAEVEQARDRIAEQARSLATLNDELALARDQALDAARAKAASHEHEPRSGPHERGDRDDRTSPESESRTSSASSPRLKDRAISPRHRRLASSISRARGRPHQPEHCDFDVREVLEGCLSRARPAAAAIGLTLDARIDRTSPPTFRAILAGSARSWTTCSRTPSSSPSGAESR
jgi:hypothetical protein